MKHPFVNRNFFLLWSGKTVSLVGDRLYGIALSWWVLERTGSAAAMGLVMTLSVVPGLAFGILCGPLVDRWNRKAILVASDVARCALVGLVAFLAATDSLSLGAVLIASVALSLCSAIFEPTAQAVIPQLVGRDDLPRANSLNQFTSGMAAVVGPVLGSVGVGLVGYAWVFAANAASYLACAALAARTRFPTDGAEIARRGYARDLRDGFRFLKGKPALLRVIAVIAVAHFFVAALMVSLPVLARGLGSVSGIGALACLESSVGLGLMLGALALGLRKKPRVAESGLYARVMSFGALFVCVAIGSRAALPSFPALLALSAAALLYGASVSQAGVLWSSILQREIPAELTGRVFSLSSLAANVAMPLSYSLVGLLLERWSPFVTLMASGVFLLAFAFALALRARVKAPCENRDVLRE